VGVVQALVGTLLTGFSDLAKLRGTNARPGIIIIIMVRRIFLHFFFWLAWNLGNKSVKKNLAEELLVLV